MHAIKSLNNQCGQGRSQVEQPNVQFVSKRDVLKQVKEMSFERMQANIVQFDDAIGSNMINGKAIERFFSMANDQGMTNRSFYSKVFHLLR